MGPQLAPAFVPGSLCLMLRAGWGVGPPLLLACQVATRTENGKKEMTQCSQLAERIQERRGFLPQAAWDSTVPAGVTLPRDIPAQGTLQASFPVYVFSF